MAKVSDNDITTGLRGMVGRHLVFRNVGGKTFVSRAPRKPDKKKETAAQRRTRSTFSDASRWAKLTIVDPQKREYYRKRAKEWNLTNPYTAAVKDHMLSKGNVAHAHAVSQPVTAIRSGKTPVRFFDSRVEHALHTILINIEDVPVPDLFSDKKRTPARAGVPFILTQTHRKSLLYHALAPSGPPHIRSSLPSALSRPLRLVPAKRVAHRVPDLSWCTLSRACQFHPECP